MSQLVPYIFEPDPPEPEETFDEFCEGLSDRETAFVLAYIGTARFTASKAAAAAGYGKTPGAQRKAGCLLLQRPHVRSAIDKFLALDSATPLESLARVTRKARASIADCFLDDPNGSRRFDMAHATESGAIESIKKLTVKRTVQETKFGKAITETVIIEMYDALEADALLLKANGVLRDTRVERGTSEGAADGTSGVVVLPDNDRVPDMDTASAEYADYVAEEAARTAEAIRRNEEVFGGADADAEQDDTDDEPDTTT